MLNLKKTAIALAVFSSSASFGGSMGPACLPGNVTVPCEGLGWDIGVQALYLQPIFDSSRAFGLTSSGFRELNNKWDWGYNLVGAYHFNTGNDVRFNWMHYDANSQAGTYLGLTPFGAAAYTQQNTNKFDQVNMVLGQHVDMGLIKNTRFYGGLQYASIRSDFLLSYRTPVVGTVTGVNGYSNADFNGVGPVFGIDYSYDLLRGISLTANTAGSILYGSSRNTNGFVFLPSGLVPASSYVSKKSIVPSFEAKLGLNYAHTMAQGVISLSGGYQVLNYLNAFTLVGTTTGISNSNYGLFGPYLGLNWHGNA